ncbi:hypothetical protein UVI_02007550 [Ustilaginoidea virens]|nr:hypothetical protein UVI_02007550 [Ustilaginoidea virens]
MSYFLQSPIFAAPAALQPLWVSAPSYTLVPLQPAAAAPPSLVIQLRGASSTGTGASVPPNPVVQIRSVSSTGTGAGTGTGFTIRIVLYSHAGPSDEWWCRTALASSAERPTRERLVAEIARLAARHGIATWRQATLVVMRDSSVPRITDEVGPVRDENVARLLELGGTDGDGCDDNDDNTVEQAMACGPASYLYVLAGGQRGGRR